MALLHRILRRVLPAPLSYVQWEWLIAFGLLEVVSSWLQLLPLSTIDSNSIQFIVTTISILAVIVLYQFWQFSNRPLVFAIGAGLILSYLLPTSFTMHQRLLIIRIVIGLSVVVAAFVGFFKYRNLHTSTYIKSLIFITLSSLIAGLLILPIIEFFSNKLNTVVHQFVAVGLVATIDILLWFHYGSLFENLGKLSKRRFNWLLILPFILILIAGWFITEKLSDYAATEIANNLNESQNSRTEIVLHISIKEMRLLSISIIGFICLFLIGLAIRSRRHAEAVSSLRAENRLHHAMFDINQAIKMLIDPDSGAIIDANSAACAFYGYTRSQMQSMNISQINALSPKEIQEEMQNAKTEQRSYFLFPHRLANGELRLMEVYSGPLKLPGRQVLFSIMHDRTEEERQAQALAERDQLLRKLSENIQGMIYQFVKPKNKTGQFLFVSDAVHRILGISVDKLTVNSKLAIDAVHPQDRRMVLESIRLSERTLKPWRCEFRVIIDNKLEWRQGDAVPEQLTNGDILWHGYLSNTTDRRVLEEELLHERRVAEESNRAKSRFLAHMSHEIRTPMNSILGFSSLLSDTRLTKEQHKYVQMVHQSGTALLSLINDILDLSRIESGKIELSNQSIDLASLIRDATGLLRLKAEEKGISMILKLEDICHPYVNTDELKLRQILLNLISNAVKFTDHGTVTVKVQNMNQPNSNTNICNTRFEVIDTGI